jgi:hypothetical protein
MKIGADLIKVLRDTLRKLEEDPEFGPEHPGVTEFRRILLLRIADLEPPIVPPDPVPDEPGLPETSELPQEPVLDPALDPAQNHAVHIPELVPLVAEAASELPIPLSVSTDPGEIN